MTRLARCAVILGLICASSASFAQDAKKKEERRYGFDPDEVTFPQKTPADAMSSIVKAFDRKRVDYLLAQMADKSYVDYWVERYMADFPDKKEPARRLLAFERLVRETTEYFQNDPLIVNDLRIFAVRKFALDAKISKLTDERDFPKDKDTLLSGKFVDFQPDSFSINTRNGEVRFYRVEKLAISDAEDKKPIEWGDDLKPYLGKLMTVTFQSGATWTEKDDVATGVIESIPARKVFLKKIDDRWFLKNEQQ